MPLIFPKMLVRFRRTVSPALLACVSSLSFDWPGEPGASPSSETLPVERRLCRAESDGKRIFLSFVDDGLGEAGTGVVGVLPFVGAFVGVPFRVGVVLAAAGAPFVVVGFEGSVPFTAGFSASEVPFTVGFASSASEAPFTTGVVSSAGFSGTIPSPSIAFFTAGSLAMAIWCVEGPFSASPLTSTAEATAVPSTAVGADGA